MRSTAIICLIAVFLCYAHLALACDSEVDHFTFVANTGEFYGIVLDSTSMCCLVDDCDEIAVYDGDLCVGASVFQNTWPLAITAWKDDPQTPQIDGYLSGNNISFRIWSYWTDDEADAAGHFESSGSSTFEGAAYSVSWVACNTDDSIGPPLLLDPENGAQNLSEPVSLSWGNIEAAIEYRLQLDDDFLFKNPVIDILTSVPFFDAYSLDGETSYFWRVLASSECGSGEWSIIRSFTTGTATGADEFTADELPTRSVLLQNYPNPFNMETRISFSLQESHRVTISVHDLLGNRVRTLLDSQHLAAGTSYVEWDGRSDDGTQVSSGIYFYKIKSGGFIDTKKMILIK